MSTTNQPLALVNDIECAKAISMSVAWLRKDRRTKHIVPVVRVGESVRYHLPSVIESLTRASA